MSAQNLLGGRCGSHADCHQDDACAAYQSKPRVDHITKDNNLSHKQQHQLTGDRILSNKRKATGFTRFDEHTEAATCSSFASIEHIAKRLTVAASRTDKKLWSSPTSQDGAELVPCLQATQGTALGLAHSADLPGPSSGSHPMSVESGARKMNSEPERCGGDGEDATSLSSLSASVAPQSHFHSGCCLRGALHCRAAALLCSDEHSGSTTGATGEPNQDDAECVLAPADSSASLCSSSPESKPQAGDRDNEPFTPAEDALLLKAICTALKTENDAAIGTETAAGIEGLQRSNRALLVRAREVFDTALALNLRA